MKRSLATRVWLAWQVLVGALVSSSWSSDRDGERLDLVFIPSAEFKRRYLR